MAQQKINRTQSNKSHSSTEVLTGDTWVDGKPIYRKSASGTSLSNLTTNFGTTPGIDNVISLSVMIKHGSDNYWRTVPWTFNAASYDVTWTGGIGVTTTGTLAFQVGTNLNNVGKSTVVMEYTKT